VSAAAEALPRWSLAIPPVGLVLLVATWGRGLHLLVVLVVAAVLVGCVLAAVHHAEVVAHRVGEPFGTLILALAVTVIEVSLIITMMIGGGAKTASLARDTVFAAVMITCNGVIGLCLLVGPLRHRVMRFHAEGSGGALAMVATLVTLSLVVPRFTTSSAGPTFTGTQLAFAGVTSLVLYGVFVFVQTIRHRDYFLPVGTGDGGPDEHADPPATRTAIVCLGLLVGCLVAVVGLAKTLSPTIEAGVTVIGAPVTVVGVGIALLVLLPETLAAIRAASRDRMQTSLNLALGSALASIGLTIPAIAVASIWLDGELVLGLGATEIVLLVLTTVVGMLTLANGRATVLQGTIHLMIFASFLFLAITP
jgi:Ca2+:H+ antiporter